MSLSTQRGEASSRPMKDLLWDGSIMLSTCPITGTAALGKLRVQVMNWLQIGLIRNRATAKILILSGTHGSEDGRSVLTDLKLTERTFYVRDCNAIGFSAKDVILSINEPRQKKSMKSAMANDPNLDQMTFQVLNLANYHQNEDKLIEDIKAFQPTVLCVAFCFSLMSDVTAALQACGDMKDRGVQLLDTVTWPGGDGDRGEL